MNSVIKEKWVAALRSGKYEQGRDRLATITNYDETTYCCLGVLCELAVEEGIAIKTKEISSFNYDNDRSYPPESVCKWAEFKISEYPYPEEISYIRNPMIGEYNLGEYNDSKGYSFKQIADLIENNL